MRPAPDRAFAAVGVGLVFALNGMLLGSLIATLPALRDRLDTTSGGISILLLTLAATAVVGMQVSGRLADRYGACRVTIVSTLPLLLGIGLTSVATSLPAAIGCMVLTGAGNGAMDVAMNALGVEVERARTHPVMTRLHAMFSVGGLSGAGLAAGQPALLGLSGERAVPVVLGTATAAGVVLALVILPRLPDPPARPSHDDRGKRIRLPKVVWLLGGLAFGIGIVEGSSHDWSAIHVTDVAMVDSSTGALGFFMVAAAMTTVRFGGDWLVARLGRTRAVQAGTVVALLGYLMVVLVTSLPLLLVGWAVVGAGVAVIAPQVYATAGHLGGGRMLAVVVTCGYSAFLAGPVLVGGLVSSAGVQPAMILPLVLCGLVLLLSPAVRSIDPADHSTEDTSASGRSQT